MSTLSSVTRAGPATAAPAPAASPDAAAPADERTRRLLSDPVLPTLLRLALPNVGEAGARITFIACDAVFVGWLGTDALAGVALVFPLFLIMQMISAGGLGAGVASAVARALGAGQPDAASRVAGQGLLLAVGIGLAIAVVMLLAGPWLYALMGADGDALAQAVVYSNIVFGGGIAVWLMNVAANAVRGTGNMVVPAGAIVIGEAVHLLLSPALILGWGPLPQLGVTGAAIGVLGAYVTGAVLLLGYLIGGRSLLKLTRAHLGLRRAQLWEILRVGIFAALNVLQFQLAVIIMTVYAGRYGEAVLAGFGAALRLELLQIPLIFAFGSAIVTMVATNVGAGRRDRVHRTAWTGAAIATVIGLGFAALALVRPDAWLGLFSHDPAVLGAGRDYLRIVGATLPLAAPAIAIFFAALGTGRIAAPFAVGLVRLAIVAVGGAIAVHLGGDDPLLLYLVAAGAVVVYAPGILLVTRRALSPHPAG